jgi:hypothetical protein
MPQLDLLSFTPFIVWLACIVLVWCGSNYGYIIPLVSLFIKGRHQLVKHVLGFSNKKQIADNESLFFLGFLVDSGLIDDKNVSAIRLISLMLHERGFINEKSDPLVRDIYNLYLKLCLAGMVADRYEVNKFITQVAHGFSYCESRAHFETLVAGYHDLIDKFFLTGKRDIK